MSAREIEEAIRQLPPDEAKAMALRLQHAPLKHGSRLTAAERLRKWSGKGKLPVGSNSDEYLEIIRHGGGC